MDNVIIIPREYIGKNFIPSGYLPQGKDENYIRNEQVRQPEGGWRQLNPDEIAQLVKNDNTADNWDELLVSGEFDPSQIKNSQFFGLVRIGRVRSVTLQHHDLRVPAGITNSRVIACDIGDDVAIHNVNYLAHYIVGDRCILFNLREVHNTDHAKFGNGILKEGEPEELRTWLEVMNESGCRKVLPFDGMISADAYLWAKYIDDIALQNRLKSITQSTFDNRRGYYGTIGNHCVIKNSLILKDVKVGDHCYIKGANKLKNITINSSEEEPTQIGEGVELVNGIIGYGCHIFYGCKGVKFVLGDNSSLKYGARLIHSFLGDNSTISCCEVLNNLIFPAHEQHHNNSFLVASVLMGQSNVAAGATIGSNHNSRANDNEIQAGRGFWPGLCTSLKHSSRFASFTLLSKADYPAELDIMLPFSLLSNNVSRNQLEVMPAYWWMYNMYALARNSWKFISRDKRVRKAQNIEFDYLAPDTVEEIIAALRLLEIWTAKAAHRLQPDDYNCANDDDWAALGRKLLAGTTGEIDKLEVLGEAMENSARKVQILKPASAYRAYNDMLCHYAMQNLVVYMHSRPGITFPDMAEELKGERQKEWINLGGQIAKKTDVDMLRTDIINGTLNTWNDIHKRYDKLWAAYQPDKQRHAFAVLNEILVDGLVTSSQWNRLLDKAISLQEFVRDQVYISRNKDYNNPFRKTTFRNQAEMNAALGTIDENSFIIQVRKETEIFKQIAAELIKRG